MFLRSVVGHRLVGSRESRSAESAKPESETTPPQYRICRDNIDRICRENVDRICRENADSPPERASQGSSSSTFVFLERKLRPRKKQLSPVSAPSP